MNKNIIMAAMAIFWFSVKAQRQTPNQIIPYDFQFYQKLNRSVYSTDKKFHSSIKGYFADDERLAFQYDSLVNYGTDTLRHNFI